LKYSSFELPYHQFMELKTRDTDEDFNKLKVLYNQRLFSEILATKESLLQV
jgi:hypothetical protein